MASRISGQSGAAFLPSRVWTVEITPGMSHDGNLLMTFRYPEGFEGYVRAIRAAGRVVRFVTPFHAVVEPRAALECSL